MLSHTKRKELAIRLRDADSAAKGVRKFIYKGRCMNPILKEEDQISVKEVPLDRLHFGDIIVYKNKDQYSVHRFLYRTKDKDNAVKIVAKADNFFERDYPFDCDYLVGKVVEIKTKKKQINLESGLAKEITYFISTTSLMEVVIFESIGKIKRKFFKWLRINKDYVKAVQGLIKAPKSLLAKQFDRIIRNGSY